MKVNVPIDLRLFCGTLKLWQAHVEGGLPAYETNHYDCLRRKIMSWNGLQWL